MSQIAMLLPVRPRAETSAGALRFRRADERDDEAIASLLDVAFADPAWTTERAHSDLTGAEDVLAVYVLERDGRLVATASARHEQKRFPGLGYVHWVGVAPSERGRGFGRDAVERVDAHLIAEGLWPIILETDDDRLPAISTYLGLGFIPHYIDDDHEERWSHVFAALSEARKSRGDR